MQVGWWYPENQDHNENQDRCKNRLRWIWTIFVALMILATSVVELLSCFRRNEFSPPDCGNGTNGTNGTCEISCDKNMISIFVIPDILLLVTYIYGVYCYRTLDVQDNLEKLADMAVKHCPNFTTSLHSKYFDALRTIRIFFILGMTYLFVSFCLRVGHAFAFQFFDKDVIVKWSLMEISGGGKCVLVIISLLGFIFFDSVYIMAIVNYCVQSELIIYALYGLSVKIVQNEVTIDGAIQEINAAKDLLDNINGAIVNIVSLIMFNLGSFALSGVIELGRNTHNACQTTVATISTMLWTLLVFIPLIQAARITKAGKNLLECAPVIRGRGDFYHIDSTQHDLDSFSTFTMSIKLKGKIFGVPVYPWMVYLLIVGFLFILLLLCQIGEYNYASFV
ncbi:uncharacterized protein [Dysidea avara]|uniref:uncharacterized protein isoform X2 n=1 Tax=Dysidea avara TaxID=196820 RepID=UPI00332EAA6F